MATTLHSETDTVVKRILPYLRRRGYDVETDITFEAPSVSTTSYAKGFVDLLVTCGKTKPQFLIEAKKSSKTLNAKDANQAIAYGRSLDVPFVVVTNGKDIRTFNARTGKAVSWDGKLVEKVPTKSQLPEVMKAFKKDAELTNISLAKDLSLPFRPSLPLKQLNGLFYQCHGTIRKIEKNEEHAFDDFSKLLFLKLLEEKAEYGALVLPYSYRFHTLAAIADSEADQVQDAVVSMIEAIQRKTSYGSVLGSPLHLKNAKTFQAIVRKLAAVSFSDSDLDSKGAAFEYFVRATLKGKKLGQYFTPRPLVRLMARLIGQEKVYNAARSGLPAKVLDPACGTGGFLVYMLQDAVARADLELKQSKITAASHKKIVDLLKRQTFFGSDANEGVACSAKMNMIVAGDGHTNIQAEDSLKAVATNWSATSPDCDIIMTNPPFGTSEQASLSADDWAQFEIESGKGQQLFIQKMISATVPGGDICTVIDDGVLNTASSLGLRQQIFCKTHVRAVVRLPEETFKPNKINVRSSVLLLRRHDGDDIDLDQKYSVRFIDVRSLGYEGSGVPLRGFDLEGMLDEIEAAMQSKAAPLQGKHWRAFDVAIDTIAQHQFRLDAKFWEPETVGAVAAISATAASIESLNTIATSRGSSPKADCYVDEKDGYALVVKAGTNISRFGELVVGGDFIEKDIFDEMSSYHLQKGDVLLASTGTGTLGKACVYDADIPAVADGHVTIIRADPARVDPYYLADYLRRGVGALQVHRLYTGSTGLIELQPDDVKQILVDLLDGPEEQRQLSLELRQAERHYQDLLKTAATDLDVAVKQFGGNLKLVEEVPDDVPDEEDSAVS